MISDSLFDSFDFELIIFVFGFAISIACVVCCIVLFFKIWGMCNDVRKILQILDLNKKKE